MAFQENSRSVWQEEVSLSNPLSSKAGSETSLVGAEEFAGRRTKLPFSKKLAKFSTLKRAGYWKSLAGRSLVPSGSKPRFELAERSVLGGRCPVEFSEKQKVIHTYLLRCDCFAPFNISLTSSAIFHPFQFMDLLLVVERELDWFL